MKKENKICSITMLLALLMFFLLTVVKNQYVKAVFILLGISLLITSIIFEKKAANPKSPKLCDFISIITKSNNRQIKKRD